AVCAWPPASAESAAGRLRHGPPIALMLNVISAGWVRALWGVLCRTAAGLRPGAVVEFGCHGDWTSVRGTSRVDSRYQRRISCGRRWAEPAALIAHLSAHAIRIACATSSRSKPHILRDHACHAVCALWHVHRAEFCSLVPVLRNEKSE